LLGRRLRAKPAASRSASEPRNATADQCHHGVDHRCDVHAHMAQRALAPKRRGRYRPAAHRSSRRTASQRQQSPPARQADTRAVVHLHSCSSASLRSNQMFACRCLTLRFSGGPRSGPSAATGCYTPMSGCSPTRAHLQVRSTAPMRQRFTRAARQAR
jgi:hypothetical protein